MSTSCSKEKKYFITFLILPIFCLHQKNWVSISKNAWVTAQNVKRHQNQRGSKFWKFYSKLTISKWNISGSSQQKKLGIKKCVMPIINQNEGIQLFFDWWLSVESQRAPLCWARSMSWLSVFCWSEGSFDGHKYFQWCWDYLVSKGHLHERKVHTILQVDPG